MLRPHLPRRRGRSGRGGGGLGVSSVDAQGQKKVLRWHVNGCHGGGPPSHRGTGRGTRPAQPTGRAENRGSHRLCAPGTQRGAQDGHRGK